MSNRSNMSVKQEEVIRPIANFPLCVWGDQFLIYDEVCKLLEYLKTN